METPRRLPLPMATSFVVCKDIYRDQRTGTTILVRPTSHVPLAKFPADVRVSVYAHLPGGHGRYQLTLCLRDSADEVVWQWSPAEPLLHDNPLFPHEVTFHDLVLTVPKLGKYSLALLADGAEFAQQGLWFGPKSAFQ